MKAIERVGAISPREFRRRYLERGKPVILTRMIDDWPAKTLWHKEYFQSQYGRSTIGVEELDDARGSDTEYYLRTKKVTQMTVADYLDAASAAGDGRLYAAQLPLRRVLPEAMKDLGKFPYVWRRLGRAAGLSELLWIGSKGCTSGLHFDLAHNFNVQIRGQRSWVIFPREQQDLLYVPSNLRLSHFSPIDYAKPDLVRYPKYRDATPIEFEVYAGETLFLPRGWVHCVRAMEFSIAINLWCITPRQAVRGLPRFLRQRAASLMRRRTSGGAAAP